MPALFEEPLKEILNPFESLIFTDATRDSFRERDLGQN